MTRSLFAATPVIEQPRSFGYTVGDIATQRIALPFQPAELPMPGPSGNWFERRSVRVEGKWLVIDYQLMNSPQALQAIALPALTLKSASGAQVQVPEWPMTVGPLTPRQPFARPGLGDLRPDRSAALVNLAPMQRRLSVLLSAFFVLILGWLGWWGWRNWRASSAQPFARAQRELRLLDESSPQAWHAVHRAFDTTAGHVVQANALGALFAQAPHLEPQRSAIERFFAASSARFFDNSRPQADVALRALCADLRQIEKRHEP